MPGQAEELELTLNHDGRTYEMGTAYGHIAIGVEDLDATLERLKERGIQLERPPYTVTEGGSRICFVRDPDSYRVEIIERKPGRRNGYKRDTAGRRLPTLPPRRAWLVLPWSAPSFSVWIRARRVITHDHLGGARKPSVGEAAAIVGAGDDDAVEKAVQKLSFLLDGQGRPGGGEVTVGEFVGQGDL